jgi:hypothetical protein
MKIKRENRNSNAAVTQRRPIKCRFAKASRFAVEIRPAVLDTLLGEDHSSRLADLVADGNGERIRRLQNLKLNRLRRRMEEQDSLSMTA